MRGLKGTQAGELVTDVICYEQMSLSVHRCRKGGSLQLHIQVSRCGWKIARYMMRDHEAREEMNLQMYCLKPSNSLWLVSIHTPYPLSLSLSQLNPVSETGASLHYKASRGLNQISELSSLNWVALKFSTQCLSCLKDWKSLTKLIPDPFWRWFDSWNK